MPDVQERKRKRKPRVTVVPIPAQTTPWVAAGVAGHGKPLRAEVIPQALTLTRDERRALVSLALFSAKELKVEDLGEANRGSEPRSTHDEQRAAVKRLVDVLGKDVKIPDRTGTITHAT